MKKVALTLLAGYQKIISPLLHQLTGTRHACRYLPTCSEYARIHIAHDGVIKGTAKSVLRVLYCQPFVRKLPKALQK